MKKLLAVIALIVLLASWAQGRDEETMKPQKISAEQFKALMARAEKDTWTSEDGELTIYLVRPGRSAERKDDAGHYLFKCGRRDPAYYALPIESGWTGDLYRYHDYDGIKCLKPGVDFAVLSLLSAGMRGGSTDNLVVFYFDEGRELRLAGKITTCWHSDVRDNHSTQLVVQKRDFDRDGSPEVVIQTHTENSYCRGDEMCCTGAPESESHGPCSTSTDEWTRVERIYDANGQDITRHLGQAPCWGSRWPEEFLVSDGDSVSPDWQNPKAWEKLDSNRFASRDFITTQPRKSWKGPSDLSFEVKLASTFSQLLFRVQVHDDRVIFDPTLRSIYRDHVELWVPSYRVEDEHTVDLNTYQLGLMPPGPGDDRGEVKVWKSCRGKCSSKAKASEPYPVERVETKWSRTNDGYEVLVRLPRDVAFPPSLAICVSDNDSVKNPGQKVMMCDRPAAGPYREIGPYCTECD